jgi:superfamily II DNA or RNA helicase
MIPTTAANTLQPRDGMLATVRNRRAIVKAVAPHDGGPDGRLHLVTLEYVDGETPTQETLVWEREVGPRLVEPGALPEPDRDRPMPADQFDALVRAARWTALTPFVDPDGSAGPLTRLPIVSPFHGAIQVEDYQLVPLLKALRMPRVSLLIADDVGLGKTIEAGLILSELIIRRRLRRVLILCPVALRSQWRREMHQKFAIAFDEVDRAATWMLRRSLGLDANPWRMFPRIVTSYDYLKQADVLEEFRAASRAPDGSPHLPWDLLIVDEAHNFAPTAFGAESDLAKMLGLLAPMFEHRLFLTATPHNGFTQSFSSLLERLDPVRFARTDELTPAERARVSEVLVRRLKREINAATNPPRFAERSPEAVNLQLHTGEQQLMRAAQAFRLRVRQLTAARGKAERQAGSFAVEVLAKRLLSCPATFANSWHRYQAGAAGDEAPARAALANVQAAARSAREDLDDDLEAESRVSHAARAVGGWLRPLANDLQSETEAVNRALATLGLSASDGITIPKADSRFDALRDLIDRKLQTNGAWRNDERLIVFTEYKTTLDYLVGRLRNRYKDAETIQELFGGPNCDRDTIIDAFNDPQSAVRILVATDAASEGLNLQETARYLLHYDVPWNPARLEQRNGRLDRHGQARDVTIHHFATDDDTDLKFLAYVVRKANTIREDLGSVGELFDAAFERRFIEGDDTAELERTLDFAIDRAREGVEIPRDATAVGADDGRSELERLQALAREVDLDAGTLQDTLDTALGLKVGRPRFDGPDDRHRFRLKPDYPADWSSVVDDSLRLDALRGRRGALAAITFDSKTFVSTINGRPIFRPLKDTALVHLAHPMVQRALAEFARTRYPGGSSTRWTVRRGDVTDADALLLLTIEELAVNELRESFHLWVRTIVAPIRDRHLGPPLSHRPALELRTEATDTIAQLDVVRARELWLELQPDVKALLSATRGDLNRRIADTIAEVRERETAAEVERFKARQAEVSRKAEQQTMASLDKALERIRLRLQAQRLQPVLYGHEEQLDDLERSERAKQEELARIKDHYEALRRQLAFERERVITHLLPKRYTLRGECQVFPVAVEIRLPRTGAAR